MAPEVAAFILVQPRTWGYARLAEACRAVFGDDAPDADAIPVCPAVPSWPGRRVILPAG